MKNLFEITHEYLDIINILEDEGGVTNEHLDNRLAIVQEQLQNKGLNYVHVIDEFKSQQERVDKEIARLQLFKEDRQRQIERLEYNLLQALLMFGKDDKLSPKQIEEGKKPVRRLEIGTLRLSTKRNPSSVEVKDPLLITDEYRKKTVALRWVTQATIDKIKELYPDADIKVDDEVAIAKIKEALEENKEVPGAALRDGLIKLVIK